MTVTRRASSRVHRNALTRLLRSTGLANVPEFAPLVAFAKDLAKQLDEGAGTRTQALYLSTLINVNRAVNSGGRARSTSESSATKKPETKVDASAEDDDQPVPNDLASFKAKRGIA